MLFFLGFYYTAFLADQFFVVKMVEFGIKKRDLNAYPGHWNLSCHIAGS